MSKSVVSLENIISLSVSHLIEEYRDLSNESGWHQYLGNDKVGNVANSQALILLKKFNYNFDKKQKVIDTIMFNQFVSEFDSTIDGGWSYRSNYNDAPTTECTAWVLLALNNEIELTSSTILNGLKWLKTNHLNNNSDLGWGSIKGDVSRVYSTCLSLKVLSKYNEKESEEFKRGINWLKSAKNFDGGWGETNGSSSKLTHTSHAIITLLECGISVDSIIIKNATKWILEQFKVSDNWSNQQNIGWREQIEFNGRRITFYHYSLAWILMALQLTRNTDSFQYKFLLNELLLEEQDGNWTHPYLKSETQKTIWSKHDALLAIHYHQQNISDKVTVKRYENIVKGKDTLKNIFTNWIFISVLAATIALALTKLVTYYPNIIDEVLIFCTVFVFVFLKNPVKRYFRIAQSLIALLVSLLILPNYTLEFEKLTSNSSGFEHIIFQLLTVEIHFIVHIIIGGLIALAFVLDFKTRNKIST